MMAVLIFFPEPFHYLTYTVFVIIMTNYLKIASLLIVLCAAVVASQQYDSLPISVPKVVSANFSASLPQIIDSVTLILFYAPWCKYSRDFLPIFDVIQTRIQKENIKNKVVLRKVDCVEETDLYWSEKIDTLGGFPVLKVYIAGGSSIIYDGERNEEAVIEYLTKFNRLPYKEVSKEQYEKILERKIYVPIVTYSKGGQSAYDIQFNYACRRASTIIRCLAVNVSDNDSESVGIHRNFNDEAADVIASSIDLGVPTSEESSRSNRRRSQPGPGDALFNWIVSNAYPAFPQFTAKSSESLFLKHRPGFRTHILFLLSSNRTDFMSSIEFVKDNIVTSPEFRGKCLMAYIDAADDSDYIVNVLNSMHLSSPSPSVGANDVLENVASDGDGEVKFVPKIAIVQSEKTKVSFYQTEFVQEASTLTNWLRSFFKGELKSYHIISTDS